MSHLHREILYPEQIKDKKTKLTRAYTITVKEKNNVRVVSFFPAYFALDIRNLLWI